MADFDKLYTIPEELKIYNYIYASGFRSDDIFRYFILPHDLYTKYLDNARNNNFYTPNDEEDSNGFLYQKSDLINRISPFENTIGYKSLLLSVLVKGENVQIRNNGNIIKKFSNEELDLIQKELDLYFH